LLVSTGRNEEGLEVAEAGRARAFADLLEQRQILGKPGERDGLAAVRLARGELQLAMADSSPVARPGGVSRAAAKVRGGEALDSSLAALSIDHDELASLLTAASPTVEEIVQTTKRLDATLVEYLVTGRQLLAWVVDAHGAIHTAKVDVSRSHLEALTKTIRDAIESVDRDTRRGAAALDSPLRELDGLLVAPLSAWLPASPDAPLVIIPHGPLALLPFAALEDEAGRPLAERHVLAFAPAASVYVYTQKKLRAAAGRTRRALIVADPSPPAGSGTERLPWAREEGRQVAARLRGTPLRLLTGKDASEAVVKREASNYSVLHFATHGLVAPERPLASSLLLAAGDGEDGYLRVDEIFNLDLTAELVVLSGCSTGLGRLTGDGMIGLTRAFLYAGTPTLVVSQWNVSDRATSVLMDHFYAELVRGRPKAQALRAAALATRKQFPHAASWAAFELVGEPR
jgi:CHAT domain-containing protein